MTRLPPPTTALSAAAAGEGGIDGTAPQVAPHQELPTAVQPRDASSDLPLAHPHLYFNRELSWIDFNWRVLAQALDARVPLLERARYLAITQSNLDEFFAKRVGGLRRQKEARVTALSPDGRTPDEQLALIREAVLPMQHAMGEAWADHVLPALQQEAGIRIASYHELDVDERRFVADIFRTSFYPILTPLAVDPGHPFPFISNLSHSFAVMLRNPATGTEHFARVKVPTARTRWVALPQALHFIAVEEVVRAHLAELFPGLEVLGAYLFRVTRNADLARSEDDASDLIEMIAEELRQRRFAPVVRLEVEPEAPETMIELLRSELETTADAIYLVPGLQDLTGLAAIANLDLPQHRFASWDPVVPGPLHGSDVDFFALLRAGDVLVHHPYDSFSGSVERFIARAAADEHVLAIKQTMYRTSDDSPVLRTLMRAAEEGKQVAVLVELSARFDEERNMEWAEQLEDSGAHVTYGVLGLKTHAKVTLVVREEEDGIRTYCHIGTGNYNPSTARLYTDVGLFTASPVVGRDVVALFHSITGYALAPSYEQLLVAPNTMRTRFETLIHNEIRAQTNGGRGRIIAKMNAIDDIDMIAALYRASQAGVQIDLIVRGHTRLRPGLPGISDNIRVISVIGRFLEHDRVFMFGNDGSPRVFIGSADWRRRNLEERVEAVVEVVASEPRNRICEMLEMALHDDYSAWDLDSDGRYHQRRPASADGVSLHQKLMDQATTRRAQFDESAVRKG
jgi:polyphosphate kinase